MRDVAGGAPRGGREVFAGGQAGLPAEDLGEVVGVGEAGGLRHIADGGVRVPEEELGVFDPHAGDVLAGGGADLLGEHPAQMGGGDLQALRQFVHALQEGELLLDDGHGGLHQGGPGVHPEGPRQVPELEQHGVGQGGGGPGRDLALFVLQDGQGERRLPDCRRAGVEQGAAVRQAVRQQAGRQLALEPEQEVQPVGHGLDRVLPRLRQQVEQAAEIPLEGVFCPMDEWDTLMDIYYNGMPEGADTGLENLDRLIKFERGFVLTVTGVPGSGKSEFVDEIAMRLLLRHDWKVGYFSPENTPLAYHYRKLIRRVVGKRFEHEGMPLPEAGQAIRYLAQSVFSIMPKEDFSVESILRIAAQLVSRKGVKVLVVDPFNRFEHQIPDWETETQYISRIFDEFSNFAVKHKVLLILVAHPTKLRREPGSKRWPVPTLYDINGSAAFFNKTDYGMVIDRNDELGQVLVRVAKVRFDHLGGPGDAFFAFSTYNGRYTPTEERTLDHNPPEPKWDRTNFLTEKLKPGQQELEYGKEG